MLASVFLFALCANLISAESPNGIESADIAIESFVHWLTDNGVKFNSEIGLLDPFGVVSSKEIKLDHDKKKLLVTIPENITLHTQTAIISDIGYVFTENPDTIKGTSRLAVFLLYQKINTTSFWKYYIDNLPDLMTPIFWSQEERNLLKGSWVLDRTEADEKAIEEDYELVFKETLFKKYPQIFSEEVYTLEEYKWSWSTIWSRSFFFDSLGLVLLPMIDTFAHTNDAKSEIHFEDKVFYTLYKTKI